MEPRKAPMVMIIVEARFPASPVTVKEDPSDPSARRRTRKILAPSAPSAVAITVAVPGRRPVMRPVAASSAITLESVFEPKLHCGEMTSKRPP